MKTEPSLDAPLVTKKLVQANKLIWFVNNNDAINRSNNTYFFMVIPDLFLSVNIKIFFASSNIGKYFASLVQFC